MMITTVSSAADDPMYLASDMYLLWLKKIEFHRHF
jgi:hypothetical protein